MLLISIFTNIKIFVLHALCYVPTFFAYKFSKRQNQLSYLFEANYFFAQSSWMCSWSIMMLVFSVTNTWSVWYPPTFWLCAASSAIASIFGSTVGILKRNEVERVRKLQMYQKKLLFYEVESEDYNQLQILIKRLLAENALYDPQDDDFMRVYRYFSAVVQRKR